MKYQLKLYLGLAKSLQFHKTDVVSMRSGGQADASGMHHSFRMLLYLKRAATSASCLTDLKPRPEDFECDRA
jgi:hypothetical protein